MYDTPTTETRTIHKPIYYIKNTTHHFITKEKALEFLETQGYTVNIYAWIQNKYSINDIWDMSDDDKKAILQEFNDELNDLIHRHFYIH